MCGILGSFNSEQPIEDSDICDWLSLISHRGPDEVGSLKIQDGFLGNRRLIIKGGNAGTQPIFNHDGSCVLVFNGEIYNFQRLAKQLKLPNLDRCLASDSYFLVEFLSKYGHTKLDLLDGAFAFAFYHLTTHTGIIARDRFGQKPLYFSREGHKILFSSELKPLLSMRPQSLRGIETIVQYLIFQNLVDDSTFYNNINTLPPGNFLVVKKSSIRQGIFWKPIYSENKNVFSEQDFCEFIESNLPIQFEIDSPQSLLLSGGIDSSLIAILLNKGSFDFSSFSVNYPDHPSHIFNEAEQVNEFCSRERISVNFVNYDYENWKADWKDVTHILEEPRVGHSTINFHAYRNSKKFANIALVGTGADELFAGYTWRYPVISSRYSPEILSPKIGMEFLLKRSCRLLDVSEVAFLLGLNVGEVQELLRNLVGTVLSQVEFNVSESNLSLNQALAFDFKTFLPGLLFVDDKLSMANSIEVRAPFLNNEVVDYALSIPKISLLSQSGDQIKGKQPLRQYMAKQNLGYVADRPKRGFSAPDAIWFEEFIHGVAWRNEVLPKLSTSGFFDISKIDRIINQSTNFSNRRGFIWSLLSLSELLQ